MAENYRLKLDIEICIAAFAPNYRPCALINDKAETKPREYGNSGENKHLENNLPVGCAENIEKHNEKGDKGYFRAECADTDNSCSRTIAVFFGSTVEKRSQGSHLLPIYFIIYYTIFEFSCIVEKHIFYNV